MEYQSQMTSTRSGNNDVGGQLIMRLPLEPRIASGCLNAADPIQLPIGLIGLNAVFSILRRHQRDQGKLASHGDSDVAAETGWQRS